MNLSKTLTESENWLDLLRKFKESLAKRLWAMPTVSEPEKELVFKEFLSDLDKFEKEIESFHEKLQSREKSAKEESELLRSLMGVPGDDLKVRTLSLSHDLASAQEKIEELSEECDVLRKQHEELNNENKFLRKRIKELEEDARQKQVQEIKLREDSVKYYSESHEVLKNQFQDLETRITNLRELFNDTSEKIVTDKQEEIRQLQKTLLDEMEKTLHRKQMLSWAEEELFAEGVAQRVRSVLVSAQGQLFLTLERLGLLDPQSKSENFWKARWKLLMEGADELSKDFKSIQAQFQEVTKALDDYLHLTHRREMTRDPVSLVDIVKKEIADYYVYRQSGIAVELFADDPFPYVIGDMEMLRFTVRALFQNALEALPGRSGRVTLNLKNRSEQGHVEIIVSDSGKGIPHHLLPRVFQPFFTTKDNRQGLSLSRAKRFVELHDGTMELVESTSNGTTFQVSLPLGKVD